MQNERTPRILIAEDELDVRNYFSVALRCHGYAVEFADDLDEALMILRDNSARYRAFLIDVANGQAVRESVRKAAAIADAVPVIVITDPYSRLKEADLRSMGAAAVLTKPVNHEQIRRALETCDLTASGPLTGLRDASSLGSPLGVAAGSWWQNMETQIRHIGGSDVPVLVQGETGAGKEVVARQLHACSPRAKKTFLKVNCAALPSELIESELFGYERGAFTGAFKNNPGKFELAQGGTILLDEIGDMDFKLQAKLLQVLQDREFLRLGASEPCRVDVRVIAATHCDLERAIEQGRFREDLYYRLNIISIQVPALRERKDEILDLARYFLHKHATSNEPVVEISSHLRDALLIHDWPGNVRELENVMRKLLVLRRCDLVVEHLRNRTRKYAPATSVAVAERPAAVPKAWPLEQSWSDSGPVQISEPPAWERVATASAAAAGFRGARDFSTRDAVVAMNGTFSTANGHSTTSVADVPGNSRVQRFASAAKPIVLEDAQRRSVLAKVDEDRREAETAAILQALHSTLWNRKRAAELLDIDYKALLYKMKKLGIAERASKVAI